MYFLLYTKCKNKERDGFFNNDDVDSLFSFEFEVMENLVRGSSVSSESQLPGALGQVDSRESPETPEITEIIENLIKVTKDFTKLKDT